MAVAVAVAVAVSGGGAVAVAVAVAVAGLTKRFFNHIQKDFLIKVWVYRRSSWARSVEPGLAKQPHRWPMSGRSDFVENFGFWTFGFRRKFCPGAPFA